MLDIRELRKSISDARQEILKPAREKADAVKLQMLRNAFGVDFDLVKGEDTHGFALCGVAVCGKTDGYQNLYLDTLTSLPPVQSLQKFIEAVLYVFEGHGDDLRKTAYPFRTVTGFCIHLSRSFEKHLNKEYAEELLRVADLYCEKYSGFRKWAFGSSPGNGHYGATANFPHWGKWFPEIIEIQEQQAAALRKSRTR